MKRLANRWSVGVCLFATAALGIWALNLFRDTRRWESEIAARERGRLAVEDELREITERKNALIISLHEAEVAESKSAQVRSDFERLTVGLLRLGEEFSAKPQAGEKAKSRPPPLYVLESDICFPEMLHDPEYLRLCMTHHRYLAESQYAPLLGSLMLSEDVRQKFLTLLAEKRLAEIEAAVLLKAKSYWTAGVTGQAKIDAIVGAEVGPEIRAVIGDEAFERYRDFERVQWVRPPVTALKTRLEVVRMPLSDAQESRLVELLYSAAKPDSETGRMLALAFSSEVVEQAKAVLTPAQWHELRALAEQAAAASRFFKYSTELSAKRNGGRKAAEGK